LGNELGKIELKIDKIILSQNCEVIGLTALRSTWKTQDGTCL